VSSTHLPSLDRTESTRAPIFGADAVALKRAGLAVLPAKGKKPIRTNFNKWRHSPVLACEYRANGAGSYTILSLLAFATEPK
jgi:hypothetical protein